MENNKIVIIGLLVIIIVLLAGILVLMPNMNKQDSSVEMTDNATANESSNSVTPDTITVKLTEYDKTYTETAGEYTVEASKWMGGSVGGFEVCLYKNGESVYKDSYMSRAYFYMDGEWKWSEWGNGEDGATYHKYPVSKGIEIQKIEVKF